MTGGARHPVVVMMSAQGTLASIDPHLRRAGVRLARVTMLTTRPIEPRRWLGRLTEAGKPDTVVITSRSAVQAGLEPWVRASGRLPRPLEIWAVGPGTTHALRRAGLGRSRRPRAVGADALVKALYRRRPRTVVYLRSDLAGARLARALREGGHRVLDLVVYRVAAAKRIAPREVHLLSQADLLVASSPSVLRGLRARIDRRLFARLTQTVPLVVLGARTLRSARGHGFRHVTVAPSTAPGRFTHHVLGVLDRADR
jgi:uroporphyrinogen-III synthase